MPTAHQVRRRSARSLEIFLWLVGTTLLCLSIDAVTRMAIAAHAAARITSLRPGVPISGDQFNVSIAHFLTASFPSNSESPSVIGRIEIPALKLITPLLSGDDSMSLTEGAGHIPGTAVPGGLGTVGIAGHRDTHFRKLSLARQGMDIRLVDRSGVYHYRVISTEIVSPDQVSVLDIQAVPGLALVTCYPFEYIGHAPKRFIVHAELVSVAPDPS